MCTGKTAPGKYCSGARLFQGASGNKMSDLIPPYPPKNPKKRDCIKSAETWEFHLPGRDEAKCRVICPHICKVRLFLNSAGQLKHLLMTLPTRLAGLLLVAVGHEEQSSGSEQFPQDLRISTILTTSYSKHLGKFPPFEKELPVAQGRAPKKTQEFCNYP